MSRLIYDQMGNVDYSMHDNDNKHYYNNNYSYEDTYDAQGCECDSLSSKTKINKTKQSINYVYYLKM